jgi:PKD repeat protein
MRGVLNKRFFSLRMLGVLLMFFSGILLRAQNCTAQFNSTVSPTGQVSFASTSTVVSTTTNYTWSFGAGYIAPQSGTAVTTPVVTYTANGLYIVTLSIASSSPSCFSQYTAAITVSLCSVNIFSVAPTGSFCTGSATANVNGLCGPVTYTWSNGALGATTGSLCPGNTYSVIAASGSTGNCCPFVTGVLTIPGNTVCPLSANFTYTQTPSGVVNFKSISSGTTALTSYTWNYGDNTPVSTGINLTTTSHTYQANGVYTPTLFLSNGASCLSDSSKVVTINSIITCSLNASLNPGPANNGTVSFVSSSSGTNSATTYTWNFGDGKVISTGTVSNIVHTYTASGVYFPYVVADNNTTPVCRDTSAIPGPSVNVFITTCSLNASFNAYYLGNLAVYFQSTSTNTIASTQFSWNFGDNTTGSGPVITHTYLTTGPYIATLTVSNSTTCIKTFTALITPIDTFKCLVKASFSHTVGATGVVSYSCTSKGPAHTHFWEFGDGHTAVDAAPTHTYTNSGNHYVKLVALDSALCRDSVTQSINITGVKCVANTSFWLQPTTTPHYYSLIPAYPYNIVAARWSWGDGTYSNGLYASHVYSVTGTFSICLSVTVSCGESSTSCISQQFVNNGGTPGSFSLNVVSPPLKVNIEETQAEMMNFEIFPNPGDGLFNLIINTPHEELNYVVSDLLGAVKKSGSLSSDKAIQLALDLPSGFYFITVSSPKSAKTSKILIER